MQQKYGSGRTAAFTLKKSLIASGHAG